MQSAGISPVVLVYRAKRDYSYADVREPSNSFGYVMNMFYIFWVLLV